MTRPSRGLAKDAAGCINFLGVVATPSSAELEEPLNADEGVGTTLSPSLPDFPKTLMHPMRASAFHQPLKNRKMPDSVLS
jgi:hypothetical protein